MVEDLGLWLGSFIKSFIYMHKQALNMKYSAFLTTFIVKQTKKIIKQRAVYHIDRDIIKDENII